MEKRGVSIFIFTIMFTLIAGAIILVFFFNFGKDLISFSNKETKVENLLILEKNLASFALSSNSEKTISFSDRSKIKIDCDANKKIILSSSDDKYSKEVKKLIFSPFQIDSNEVEAWTLAWNYPFKIDNLYFIADKDVTFYFPDATSSSPKAQYFINKFKQTRFNWRLGLPTSQLDKGIVVYFNSPTPMQGDNIKVVSFENIDSNEPKVKFKKENFWSNYFPIYGDAMLYAAIFSADEKKFSCILNGLAKERVSNLVEIYKDTIEKLKQAEECQDTTNYEEIGPELDKLSTRFGLSTDPRAYEPAKKIKEQNDILKTTNCPILYKSSETMRLV